MTDSASDRSVEELVQHWFRPVPGEENKARAEAAVRELFERLHIWTGQAVPRITWSYVAKEPRFSGSFGVAYVLASDATVQAAEETGATAEQLLPDDARLPVVARFVLRDQRAWDIAVAHDCDMPTATWPPQAVRGKRFRELRSPFAPILDVWKLGYLIEADDESATLFAPIATVV